MPKRVIALMGQPTYNEDGVAAEAITPGHLITGVTSLTKHATAAAQAPPTFALERDEMGKSIDDAYAIGDSVKAGTFYSGQRVYGFIASGQNIAINALLESAGNGGFRVLSTGEALVKALEAVNNTAGPGMARIRLEVL